MRGCTGGPVRTFLFHRVTRFLCTEHIPSSRVGCGGFPCRQLCLIGVRSSVLCLEYFGVRKTLAFHVYGALCTCAVLLSVWFAIHPSNIRGAS